MLTLLLFFVCLCPFRDDLSIASTNPDLSLPPAAITVVQLGYANDVNLAASRLCAKVDSGWAAAIGVSAHPALPHVANITAQQNVGGLASFVLDTPYSIGFVSPVAVRVSLAQLVNQAGKSVAATPATVSQATLELIANGILAGGNGFDLSNAQSAYAWPVSVKKKNKNKKKHSAWGRRALTLLPPPLLSDSAAQRSAALPL